MTNPFQEVLYKIESEKTNEAKNWEVEEFKKHASDSNNWVNFGSSHGLPVSYRHSPSKGYKQGFLVTKKEGDKHHAYVTGDGYKKSLGTFPSFETSKDALVKHHENHLAKRLFVTESEIDEIYDPITKKDVKRKAIKVSIGGGWRKTDPETGIVTHSSDPSEIGKKIKHESVDSVDSVIEERTLTSNEIKKKEEIATAIEKDNPAMDKSKKIAIATAIAKKVAESKIDEASQHNLLNRINSDLINMRGGYNSSIHKDKSKEDFESRRNKLVMHKKAVLSMLRRNEDCDEDYEYESDKESNNNCDFDNIEEGFNLKDPSNKVHHDDDQRGAKEFADHYKKAHQGLFRKLQGKTKDDKEANKFYDTYHTKNIYTGKDNFSGRTEYTHKKTGEKFTVDRSPYKSGFEGSNHVIFKHGGANESSEINELSSEKITKYLRHAAHNRGVHRAKVGFADSQDMKDYHDSEVEKRNRGISLAIRKSVKMESEDPIDLVEYEVSKHTDSSGRDYFVDDEGNRSYSHPRGRKSIDNSSHVYSRTKEEPHAVHIDGKKWKTFQSKTHADNVAAKFSSKNPSKKVDVVKENLDENFSKVQIDTLKQHYSKIKTIDPDGASYKALVKVLDSLDQNQLKQLANEKISFVSNLARNRVKR